MDKPVYKKWFEWHTPKAEGGFGFTAGDYRTYADLVDPSYRLGDGVAKLMSLYGYNSDEYFNSDYDTEAMVNAAVSGLLADEYYPREDTDKNGVEYKVKNICPHLKCNLIFNNIDKTWDCPCHGSRFDKEGNVLFGPSVYDIKVDK